MNRLQIKIGIGFGLLLVFWLGVIVNFPGESLSRMVEAQAKIAAPQLVLKLQPASLGLLSINLDTVIVHLRQGDSTVKVVELKEVSIPLSWRLFSGLPLQAMIGAEGEVDLFIGWGGQRVEVEASAIRLEDIPAWEAMVGAKIKGGLDLIGAFNIPKIVPNKPPQPLMGELTGSLAGVEIENLKVMGASIPNAKIDSVDLKILGGKTIELTKFAFKGDIQGEIKGSLTPQMARIESSRLDLELNAAFRETWLNGLGALKPIADSFLKNGRITGHIAGTLNQPKWVNQTRG